MTATHMLAVVTLRPFAFALLGALTGCSRTEAPQPKAVAEPTRDAATARAPDAGARAAVASPSLFTIVARAPTALAARFDRPVDELGRPMPLVQRLPGGGLVVASEYARARADGSGGLTVELLGRGFESDILYRPSVTQSYEGLRWVWSDASLSIVVAETETSRSGPRLVSYKLGAKGFQVLRPNLGYWSAAVRDESVFALERTAYEVPNSSMYRKGSGSEQNEWRLKRARIAVLSGKAVAPAIPAGLCPTAMGAAPDGTLVVTVDKCTDGAGAQGGVLRFAPSATQANVEWFAPRKKRDGDPDEVATFAASANEIYVVDGDRLQTWNGKEWASTRPFPDESIGSISRAPNGELWAVIRDNARLVKRSADGATWSPIPLPDAPADRLDERVYALPTFEVTDFLAVDEPPDGQEVRGPGARAVIAYSVDATAEEVLVLATAEHEAFVMSTKPRTPVARLPSIPVQRARLAQTLKREPASSQAACKKSFLMFPEATTVEMLRSALGDAGAADAGKSSASVGDAIVEGQTRLVLYGDQEGIAYAAKRLAPLGPKRICGPAVVERSR